MYIIFAMASHIISELSAIQSLNGSILALHADGTITMPDVSNDFNNTIFKHDVCDFGSDSYTVNPVTSLQYQACIAYNVNLDCDAAIHEFDNFQAALDQQMGKTGPWESTVSRVGGWQASFKPGTDHFSLPRSGDVFVATATFIQGAEVNGGVMQWIWSIDAGQGIQQVQVSYDASLCD